MNIIKIDGKGYASNTYILISDNDCAVIDPSSDINDIKSATGEAKIRYILLTHGHFDHILNLEALREISQAKIYIHKNDYEMPCDPAVNASKFFGIDFASVKPDETLTDGDLLHLGSESIKIISTPGHTPGSVCYDCGDALICGDTLFSMGYGRHDLPGGDPHALFSSLSMLAQREDNPIIHPGHGESSTLASADIIKTIRNNNF